MPHSSNIGTQAINKLTEATLRSQMNEVEALSVEVETSSQLSEGAIDAVTIDGTGVSFQDQIRTETLHIKTGAIAVNPWKAILGNIELQATVDAIAEMSFTAEDIRQALNAEEIYQQVSEQSITLNGTLLFVQPQNYDIHLEESNHVHIQVSYLIMDESKDSIGKHPPDAMTLEIRATLHPEKHRIVFNDVVACSGTHDSKTLINRLLTPLNTLFDMKYFQTDGMQLEISSFSIQPHQLMIKSNVQIRELP